MKKLISISCYILVIFIAVAPVRSLAALDEGTCASLVVTNLKTLNTRIDAEQDIFLTLYWTQICKGILDHIKAAAVVTVTSTGATLTGPAGGPLPISALPGTGTVD